MTRARAPLRNALVVPAVLTGLLLPCRQIDVPPGRGAVRASQLPNLVEGSRAPAGSAWIPTDASACNRVLPDDVRLDRPNSLDYTGRTPADLLQDASRHGGLWRMAAVTPDGRVVATTTWCSPPVGEAPSPAPVTPTAPLDLCGCQHAASVA
ncbi:MAG: hypothetical protein ACR2KK_21785 [Acidimicrobiales bacterium]